MRSRYKFIEKEAVYFVTWTVVEWLPIFTSSKYCEIVIESLKFARMHRSLELYAYVILDNHCHFVVFGPELSRLIAAMKRHTARQIINSLREDKKNWLLTELAYYKKKYKTKSDYQVWQEGSHPQLMMSDDVLVQKIRYIHNNPVERGLVDVPEHWRYSSARNYLCGDDSIIEIDRLPI